MYAATYTATEAGMLSTMILSDQDIDRLLNEQTPSVRVDLADKIAGSHLNRQYSLHDFAIAEQVMRILVKDTEVKVREALATRLKENPYIPRDIILALSHDVESVALPVLEHSPLLSDAELISVIVTCKSVSKQSAIAMRKAVSKDVSVALVSTHNSEVVEKLAKNHNADIPAEAYHEIIRDHGKNQIIMKAVAERPNLPVTIVEKVISMVSDSLARDMRAKYDIDQSVLALEADKTREVATLMLVDGNAEKQEVEKLVEQLQAYGRLTPSIILTSLCRGNLYFFETSLARLSSIPVRNAQLLIHDKGGLGFKALYNKAGLPDKFFAACKVLLEVVAMIRRAQPSLKGTDYSNQVIHNLLAKTAGQNVDNLSYIIALIRQAA
ncbi:MAG TPA: DUF2336 domain-containing protein [Rickettsiales bacterium]|nr:DUF2336 domain-containing protein [Rickettsiales bacterium]